MQNSQIEKGTDNIQISVVSINYNGLKDTCEMIDSIRSNVKSVSYEIIIVDNASRENEAEVLNDRYPDITVIKSTKNLGFSGGNNLGILRAKGKYIFLLNNDVIIKDDSWQYLIERLNSDIKIGVVSPKIRFSYGDNKIQFAGFTPLSRYSLRNAHIGSGEIDKGQYDNAQSTPYAHGAAMLLKREVIEKAGLMPELFFLYYEELDWSTTISEQGYELWYEPRATVYHKESQSVGFGSPIQIYYLTRNRLLYAYRHRKGVERIVALCYLLTLPIIKNILVFSMKRKFNLVNQTLKGVVSFLNIKNKNKQYDYSA